MVARCLNLLIITAALGGPVLAWASSGNDRHHENQPVVDYLSHSARLEIKQLEQEIERCSHAARSREISQDEVLADLQSEYGREALISALGHLHFRNQLQCELAARQSLSYTLATLDSVADDEAVIVDEIASYPRSLLYPSARELAYELRYEDLPSELKGSLEALLGSEPFDLLTVLDFDK
ncbi:hypothetical protein [Halopseudomonas salegens]|uniref:Uncharacterized protein n=1 Tax=Halopseudomonas salegens TaxID=1434072 RepID=A0A1H2FGL7_9GAMM|nr:hypothetical protein [Halopseudomonas salegens]SDU06526.1 hypothetical protein SAMN05216210_1547 [Halopseudomonas salegens]